MSIRYAPLNYYDMEGLYQKLQDNEPVRYLCVGILFYDTDAKKYTFKELYSIAMLQDSLAGLYPHWNSRFIGPFLASVQSSFNDNNPDMEEQIKGFTNSVRFGDILESGGNDTIEEILERYRRGNMINEFTPLLSSSASATFVSHMLKTARKSNRT